jgi:hypothetical protein
MFCPRGIKFQLNTSGVLPSMTSTWSMCRPCDSFSLALQLQTCCTSSTYQALAPRRCENSPRPENLAAVVDLAWARRCRGGGRCTISTCPPRAQVRSGSQSNGVTVSAARASSGGIDGVDSRCWVYGVCRARPRCRVMEPGMVNSAHVARSSIVVLVLLVPRDS